LFEFQQQAFKNEEPFEDDTRKLREAIQHDSCTRTEWRPYAALHRSRTGSTTSA
jgi:hypothetical protein